MDPDAPTPPSDFSFFDPARQTTKAARKEAAALLSAVEQWSDPKQDSPPWLLILGGVGVGKSALLRSATWQMKLEDRWVLYLPAYEFDRRVRDFNPDSNTNSVDNWLERISSWKDAVVLDDIGSGHLGSEWIERKFEMVLDLRYERRLRTALTTNLVYSDFGNLVGERVMSRLNDTRLGRIIDSQHCRDMRPRL